MKRAGAYKLYVGDKFYVGSSNDVDYRRACHVTMLRKGNHPNPVLQDAWNRQPESVRSTVLRPLEPLETDTEKTFRDRLRAAEQELLDFWAGNPDLANTSMNSRGPDKRVDVKAKWKDPVFRERMVRMLRERGSPSKETRAKMSEAKKGSRNIRSRPVRVTWPDGRVEVFPTGTAAAIDLKVTQQLVHLWVTGRSPQPGSMSRKYWLEGVRVEFEGS